MMLPARSCHHPVARRANVLNVAMQSLSAFHSWFVAQLGHRRSRRPARLVFPTQMALGQMSAGANGRRDFSSSWSAAHWGPANRAAAEAAAAHALVIALGMAALFAIVFVGFGRQHLRALGGSGPGALDGAEAFATVLFLGCAAPWDRPTRWPRCCAAPAT